MERYLKTAVLKDLEEKGAIPFAPSLRSPTMGNDVYVVCLEQKDGQSTSEMRHCREGCGQP
jgi:hypothetical protein